MWYRKAMDLNDLNREFPEEREQVIDFMEEEKGKEDVENLSKKYVQVKNILLPLVL